MTIDPHLDIHYTDEPIAFDEIGKVVAILAKDHAQNPTGTITLYDVETYFQKPSLLITLPAVQILGQMSGGDELEDPLSVGDFVVVRFLGGSVERPYVAGRWQSQESTAVAQAQTDHPRTRIIRRQNILTVDKNGDAELQMAPSRSLKVKNSGGTILLEIVDPGTGYEVHVGGDTGLLRLLTENFVGALATIFTSSAVAPGDGGATLKTNMATALNAALTAANSTSTARAK